LTETIVITAITANVILKKSFCKIFTAKITSVFADEKDYRLPTFLCLKKIKKFSRDRSFLTVWSKFSLLRE